MKKGSSLASYKSQQGATLFTALVFLTLMTIVSVSATKLSMLDLLIAGNNQQQMLLFQTTENDLTELATPVNYIETFIAENNELTSWVHNVANTDPDVSETITNREMEYQCGGISGKAVSMSPDSSCRMFDFEVEATVENTSVRDKHIRGAGKEFPKASRNNFNN